MDSDSDSSVINLDSSENDLETDSNTNAMSTPKKKKIVPIYTQNFNEHWLQDVELKDWSRKQCEIGTILYRYFFTIHACIGPILCDNRLHTVWILAQYRIYGVSNIEPILC